MARRSRSADGLPPLPPGGVRYDLSAILKPTPKQARFLAAARTHRFRLALCGRGFGKTWMLTLDVLLQMLANPGVTGALCGRTERDLTQTLRPQLETHLQALQEATGVNWVREYNGDNAELVLINGASVLFRPYNLVDKLRGLNLGWADLDEVEFAICDPCYAMDIINACVRDPRCSSKSIAAATSPNGLLGLTKRFVEQQAVARDPDASAAELREARRHFVIRGTSYDNPTLSADDVEGMAAGMSRRRRRVEIFGEVLRPTGVIFPEFSTELMVPWNWREHEDTHEWILCVDWGTTTPYACAVQVHKQTGQWIVVEELTPQDLPRGKFRDLLLELIKKRKRAPYLAATDRAVPLENNWLQGVLRSTFVESAESKIEQAISNGIEQVRDMLDPADRSEDLPLVERSRILFSAELRRDVPKDAKVGGIVPSLLNYRFLLDSDGNPTDRPYHDPVFSHAVDALRYGVVRSRFHPRLHGGVVPRASGLGPDGTHGDGKRSPHRAHW